MMEFDDELLGLEGKAVDISEFEKKINKQLLVPCSTVWFVIIL